MNVSSYAFVIMCMVLASVCITAGEHSLRQLCRQADFADKDHGIAMSRSRSEATRACVQHQLTCNLTPLSHIHTGMLPLCTKVAAGLPQLHLYGNRLRSQAAFTPLSLSHLLPIHLCRLANCWGLASRLLGPPIL